MKHYIVTWWNGETDVWAENESAAKATVAGTNIEYRYGGRGASLFVKEI